MKNIKIFGEEIIDPPAIDQLKTCVGDQDFGVLTADAHVGYGHPIGGAIAYKDHISLSGVGFDIACGNKAVRTNLKTGDIDIKKVMDEVVRHISFGMGRINKEEVEHEVIDKIRKIPVTMSRAKREQLFQVGKNQLGTVGGGNHFVDLFEDQEGYLWIGVHFGSRGFGHKITTGFISIAQGSRFEDQAKEGGMFSKPILFELGTQVAEEYIQCLKIAGEYAYAGRDWVVDRVLQILENPEVTYEVHNHHNFAWEEEHFGETYWVVRKGCTPAFPDQKGFIGANMFDTSVIVEGLASEQSASGLYSTVHGAGRVLSRRKALGKVKHYRENGQRKMKIVKPGLVNYEQTQLKAKKLGIELRGGGADESPECYKNLDDVLYHQGETIRVLHRLKPIGVAMAGHDIVDPYKD
ncbi:RtcB family protein [Portibacter marinus]|uniref:RtcB family protein n=1 Tax=Portibacter marinus TaxID=2898660 RepID=UPI001F317E3D|nr:RtcB family protein [Portibacter marinus]